VALSPQRRRKDATMIHNLAVSTETFLSKEIAHFRAQIFPNVYLSGQFDDIENIIDASSLHIILHLGSDIVGSVCCRL
jgi:hypothetical protein